MARTANQKTRDSLMEAAFGLVRRQGLAANRVDEICAAAGVSKGTFFYHFGSKDELAAAVMRTGSSKIGLRPRNRPDARFRGPRDET